MAALNGSKYLIFGVAGLANLVVAFSVNSMNLALPTLAAEFQVSQSTISWLMLIYSLTPCCTLLFFGRLGDLYGYRRQFLLGFLFFGIVSLLIPLLAVSLNIFIFFRCLQGFGYSMLMSITQGIVSRTFDENERGKALGINSMFVSVGSASGPTIGGMLIEYFSWHAIFLFNVPLCAIGFLITMAVLKDDSPKEAVPPKDWIGSMLFAMSVGLLIIGFNFIGDWGWLSGRFLFCILGSACSLGLFIKYEKRVKHPLMQLKLFQNATFSLANGVSACNYLTQQMTNFLIPFFLINILSMKSDSAGLIILVLPLAMMISSPVGGDMADKYGTRLPTMLGLFMIGVGCAIMSLLTESSGIIPVAGMLALLGAGNGYSVSATNTAIISAVPQEQTGVASGMIATMRTLGQTLGTTFGSIIVAVRQNVYAAGSLVISKDVYLKAERDALYFGIFVICIALLLNYKIPDRKRSAPS